MDVYVYYYGRKFKCKTFNIDDTTDRIRQWSFEKYLGCKFLIKIIHANAKGQDIEVHVNARHNGDELGLGIDA
jgi:hypothetical protein